MVKGRIVFALLGSLALLSAAGAPASAQTAEEPATRAGEPAGEMTLELNRLEPLDGACRTYFILVNGLGEPLDALELDTFMFDPDGVITQRLALLFDDVRPDRRKVFLFDLDTPCAGIGSILVNAILSCRAGGTEREDCGEILSTASRAEAALDW